MSGPDDLGTQRMFAFRANLSRYTGDRPRRIYFLAANGAALIWTHPDHRWVLSVPDTPPGDEDADALATVRRVLGVPRLELDLLATSRWTAAAQTATRLSHGPVFLIGDAGHRFPPAGATA
jgi:2-polyprenyl-6-methoxyphenol hydroxylase-like FAD-dependent oxidoreductase